MNQTHDLDLSSIVLFPYLSCGICFFSFSKIEQPIDYRLSAKWILMLKRNPDARMLFLSCLLERFSTRFSEGRDAISILIVFESSSCFWSVIAFSNVWSTDLASTELSVRRVLVSCLSARARVPRKQSVWMGLSCKGKEICDDSSSGLFFRWCLFFNQTTSSSAFCLLHQVTSSSFLIESEREGRVCSLFSVVAFFLTVTHSSTRNSISDDGNDRHRWSFKIGTKLSRRLMRREAESDAFDLANVSVEQRFTIFHCSRPSILVLERVRRISFSVMSICEHADPQGRRHASRARNRENAFVTYVRSQSSNALVLLDVPIPTTLISHTWSFVS